MELLVFFITSLMFQIKLAYSYKHAITRLCAFYILIESKHSFSVLDVHENKKNLPTYAF